MGETVLTLSGRFNGESHSRVSHELSWFFRQKMWPPHKLKQPKSFSTFAISWSLAETLLYRPTSCWKDRPKCQMLHEIYYIITRAFNSKVQAISYDPNTVFREYFPMKSDTDPGASLLVNIFSSVEFRSLIFISLPKLVIATSNCRLNGVLKPW